MATLQNTKIWNYYKIQSKQKYLLNLTCAKIFSQRMCVCVCVKIVLKDSSIKNSLLRELEKIFLSEQAEMLCGEILSQQNKHTC